MKNIFHQCVRESVLYHMSKSLKSSLQGTPVAAFESCGTRQLLPVKLNIPNCAKSSMADTKLEGFIFLN